MERELGLLSLWTGVGQCVTAAGCLQVQVAGSLSGECGTLKQLPESLKSCCYELSLPIAHRSGCTGSSEGHGSVVEELLGLFVCLFIYFYVYGCFPHICMHTVFGGQKTSLRG